MAMVERPSIYWGCSRGVNINFLFIELKCSESVCVLANIKKVLGARLNSKCVDDIEIAAVQISVPSYSLLNRLVISKNLIIELGWVLRAVSVCSFAYFMSRTVAYF